MAKNSPPLKGSFSGQMGKVNNAQNAGSALVVDLSFLAAILCLWGGRKTSCHFWERKVKEKMRSSYVEPDVFRLLLTALMPENRLALEVSLATGLRIGDVLSLKTKDLQRERFTIKEQKTGKSRRVYLPVVLRSACRTIAGRYFVFENRLTPNKPRTRQAVYKDLKRVARLYRLNGRKLAGQISPHTARKVYAVGEYHRTGSLEKVQHLLNHSSEAVTMLYALADELEDRSKGRK